MSVKPIQIFLALTLCAMSCSRGVNNDTPDEDYGALFPFTGIDKPITSRQGVVQRPCDPALPATDYTYPGTEVESPEHTYTITLNVMFSETDMLGQLITPSTSRYYIHYVDANKEFATIVCHKNDMAKYHLGLVPDDDTTIISVPETRYSFTLENGVEKTVRFNVSSGFPLYLCVDGEGPTNSTIKASITAESHDGLITVPTLSTEQTQNEIGAGRVKYPYCQTITLP